MKANITFDLPEETGEMQGAIAATFAWCALHEIRNEIRKHEKHGVPIDQVIERIKDHIADALLARGEA